LGGVIKGATAFGFPLFTTPLLAALLGPKAAVVVLVVPVLVSNAMVLITRPASPRTARRLLPILVPLVPATIVGSLLLARADGAAVAMLVGLLGLLFVAFTFRRGGPTLPPHAERWVAPAVGVVSGFLNGASGISGPVVVAYVDALRLNPRGFAYSVTILFTATGLVQAASYAALGLFDLPLLGFAALLLPAALLGQQLGFRLQDRLAPERFRQVVLGLVAVASANLVLRGLSGA
jgi:uncharacterized protein